MLSELKTEPYYGYGVCGTGHSVRAASASGVETDEEYLAQLTPQERRNVLELRSLIS